MSDDVPDTGAFAYKPPAPENKVLGSNGLPPWDARGVDPNRSDEDIKGYHIINRRQGNARVGYAKTKAGARRARDRRDNEYGGYAHSLEADYG